MVDVEDGHLRNLEWDLELAWVREREMESVVGERRGVMGGLKGGRWGGLGLRRGMAVELRRDCEVVSWSSLLPLIHPCDDVEGATESGKSEDSRERKQDILNLQLHIPLQPPFLPFITMTTRTL